MKVTLYDGLGPRHEIVLASLCLRLYDIAYAVERDPGLKGNVVLEDRKPHEGLPSIVAHLFRRARKEGKVPARIDSCAAVQDAIPAYVFPPEEGVRGVQRLRVERHLRSQCLPCWNHLYNVAGFVNIKK